MYRHPTNTLVVQIAIDGSLLFFVKVLEIGDLFLFLFKSNIKALNDKRYINIKSNIKALNEKRYTNIILIPSITNFNSVRHLECDCAFFRMMPIRVFFESSAAVFK